LHRERRGARLARRDDREYREYLREEQRSQARGPQRGTRVGVEEGCIAVRMQLDFHHGLLWSLIQFGVLLLSGPIRRGFGFLFHFVETFLVGIVLKQLRVAPPIHQSLKLSLSL
jgi:hypothetical protein